MANTLDTISSSKSSIYSKLLNLAANGNYINDPANTDFLKAGLFGYVTESLAMIIRDSAFHKTMLYKENYLNTAIMPKSIYNWAKMFNVDVITARPSIRTATFKIDLASVESAIMKTNTVTKVAQYKEKYGVEEQGQFMIIDKSNPIIAGSTYFSLEHSIQIYKNTNRNKSYVVRYCLNEKEKTTEFAKYPTAVLNSNVVTSSDGITYLVFEAKIAQYRTQVINRTITTSSFLDTKVHNFNYIGQVCGMNLKYTKNNKSSNVDLYFSNIDTSDRFNDTNNLTAYYSLIDDSNVEIKFYSNNQTGLPQAGGSLDLKLFITDGAAGNITYTGDAIFTIQQEDLKNLAFTVGLNQILTSGITQASLGDLKNTIINKISAHNTIITENDLNLWFQVQSTLLENINNSLITFRKAKDNILKRTFDSFLLLRDGLLYASTMSGDNDEIQEKYQKAASSYISNVIPTNTIDLTILPPKKDNNEGDELLIKNGTFMLTPEHLINYVPYNNTSQGKFVVNAASGYTQNDLTYVTPFYIKVDIGDYLKSSYYYLDTNQEVAAHLNTSESNNITALFFPTTTKIQSMRHADGIIYSLEFYVSSNIDLSTLNNVRSSLVISNNKNSSGTSVALLEKLKIEKISDNESDSEVAVNNYKIIVPLKLKDIVDSFDLTQLSTTHGENDTAQINLFEKTSFKLKIHLQDNSNTIEAVIGTEEPLTIFSSIDDVMNSDVEYTYKINEGKKYISSITLKGVPVVASYWYNSTINKEYFIQQLMLFIEMLKENTSVLETNTFFNIKFRNTYGISNYFDSVNTNVRLELVIHLKGDYIASVGGSDSSEFEEILMNEIRDNVRILVDQSNSRGSLKVSEIIMLLQSKYNDYIDHIDFKSLAGSFRQYMTKIESGDSTLKYPLEYYSLDTTLELDEITNQYVSRLVKDITFVKI